MKKQKQTYEAPEAQTFVVRFEGCLCTSPGYSANGLQQGNIVSTDSGVFDDWDD